MPAKLKRLMKAQPAWFPRFPALRYDLVLASIMLNILALATPIVILQVYDRVIPFQSYQTLTLLIIGLTFALILEAILRYFRATLSGWEGAKYQHHLAMKALDNLLRMNILRYEQRPPGFYVDQVRTVDQLRDFYANQYASLIIDIPFAFIFVGVIAFISPWLGLVAAIIFIVSLFVTYRYSHTIEKEQRKRSGEDDKRYSYIMDVLRNTHMIKSLACENQLLRRYERLQEGSSNNTYNLIGTTGFIQTMSILFSQITLVAIVAIGSLIALRGELTIGSLAASALLAGRAMQPLIKGIGVWSYWQNIQVIEDRLKNLLEPDSHAPVIKPILPMIKGRVEVRNLYFRYPKMNKDIIRDLSFVVNPGEMVALVGPGGIGKSTLLQIIMGVLEPTSGQVLIDGYDINTIDRRVLRQFIAYLSQRGTLFQGTLKENLTLFGANPDNEAILKMLSTFGLEEIIDRLPSGLDTQVNDNDFQSLAFGIKQRLMVARDLARPVSIILFDEANANFDMTSDSYLRQALLELKGHKTIILVSYRPSIIKLADRIIELPGPGDRTRPALEKQETTTLEHEAEP